MREIRKKTNLSSPKPRLPPRPGRQLPRASLKTNQPRSPTPLPSPRPRLPPHHLPPRPLIHRIMYRHHHPHIRLPRAFMLLLPYQRSEELRLAGVHPLLPVGARYGGDFARGGERASRGGGVGVLDGEGCEGRGRGRGRGGGGGEGVCACACACAASLGLVLFCKAGPCCSGVVIYRTFVWLCCLHVRIAIVFYGTCSCFVLGFGTRGGRVVNRTGHGRSYTHR